MGAVLGARAGSSSAEQIASDEGSTAGARPGAALLTPASGAGRGLGGEQ